jgi:hypothetical protein
MATWSVSFRAPVLIEVEVEADNEEDAIEQAERHADFTRGEVDGLLQFVEAVEEEGTL